MIEGIPPELVAVGYDNRNNRLPEPPLEDFAAHREIR